MVGPFITEIEQNKLKFLLVLVHACQKLMGSSEPQSYWKKMPQLHFSEGLLANLPGRLACVVEAAVLEVARICCPDEVCTI